MDDNFRQNIEKTSLASKPVLFSKIITNFNINSEILLEWDQLLIEKINRKLSIIIFKNRKFGLEKKKKGKKDEKQ